MCASCSAKQGLGWVPYLQLARLDHEYDKYRDLIHDATLTMQPA